MVIGHQKIIFYLNQLIKNKNILRNYLFLGSESVGKSKIAHLFVRAILSDHQNLENSEECLCSVCQSIRNNICPDFILINKDQEVIGIDDIRELKKKLLFKPIYPYRLVLIEQAQNLNDEASNAILKILEDIASPTFFIFLATHLLKPTIISRLEVIKFHLLSEPELNIFFKNSAFNFSPELIGEIKYLAAGRAGKLMELIASPTHRQSAIDFFNEFVIMMKSSIKGQLVYIDNYLKKDGSTSVFLDYWLKILSDSLAGYITGQARIPDNLREKLPYLSHNSKDLVKFLKRILLLKELDSRYNLNKRLLLEQVVINTKI